MKKFFKGFTLIECLVALAILGIGSLIMAQIYANVSRINLSNHRINMSLSYQMKIVETKTDSDCVKIYYGDSTKKADNHSVNKSGDGAPPSKVSDVTVQKNFVEITKKKSDGTLSNESYSFPVDIYVLLSRDADNDPSMKYNTTTKTWVDNPDFNGDDEKNYNLRYRYILGHNN